MKYKLSDEIVHAELKIICFNNQIVNIPFGSQERVNFIPKIPMEFNVEFKEIPDINNPGKVIRQEIHSIDREKTLKFPDYTSFTQDQIALILEQEKV